MKLGLYVLLPGDGVEVYKVRRSDQVRHLLPDGGVPGSPLVLDGLPVHAHLETPPEPTAPTLVTVGLVYHTALPLPTLAPVLSAPSDGPLEEPRTPVTREDPVVLPGREIPAHLAGNIVQDTTTGTAGVLRAENILLQKIFHRKKYFKPFKLRTGGGGVGGGQS